MVRNLLEKQGDNEHKSAICCADSESAVARHFSDGRYSFSRLAFCHKAEPCGAVAQLWGVLYTSTSSDEILGEVYLEI